MKLAITWTLAPQFYQTAMARFLDTGALPPAGVNMIGRWHSLDGSTGIIIAESADSKAILAWTAKWTDVCTFTVTPVVDDADAASVLQGLRK